MRGKLRQLRLVADRQELVDDGARDLPPAQDFDDFPVADLGEAQAAFFLEVMVHDRGDIRAVLDAGDAAQGPGQDLPVPEQRAGGDVAVPENGFEQHQQVEGEEGKDDGREPVLAVQVPGLVMKPAALDEIDVLAFLHNGAAGQGLGMVRSKFFTADQYRHRAAAQANDAGPGRVEIPELQGRESDGAIFIERHRDLGAQGPAQGGGMIRVLLGDLGRIDQELFAAGQRRRDNGFAIAAAADFYLQGDDVVDVGLGQGAEKRKIESADRQPGGRSRRFADCDLYFLGRAADRLGAEKQGLGIGHYQFELQGRNGQGAALAGEQRRFADLEDLVDDAVDVFAARGDGLRDGEPFLPEPGERSAGDHVHRFDAVAGVEQDAEKQLLAFDAVFFGQHCPQVGVHFLGLSVLHGVSEKIVVKNRRLSRLGRTAGVDAAFDHLHRERLGLVFPALVLVAYRRQGQFSGAHRHQVVDKTGGRGAGAVAELEFGTARSLQGLEIVPVGKIGLAWIFDVLEGQGVDQRVVQADLFGADAGRDFGLNRRQGAGRSQQQGQEREQVGATSPFHF